jgi:hypothetical protein
VTFSHDDDGFHHGDAAIVSQHGLGDPTNEEKNFIITAHRSFSTISCPALLFIMFDSFLLAVCVR